MNKQHSENVFITGSLTWVFLKTAAPIILIMLVNGSFNLVDAYFLGIYVGSDALSAVTSMFPAFMLMVALSTLVANGFSSVLARTLGAGDIAKSKKIFAQAITLSLVVCSIFIGMFFVGGHAFTLMANNQSTELASMSYAYMSLIILFSPLGFILSINGDSLRCEGRIGLMIVVSLSSVILNGIFNYVFIVHLNLGVAGSALGTILAQFVSIVAIFLFRKYRATSLDVQVISFSFDRDYWKDFLALGAPSSLTYIGLALSSAAILFNLQLWNNSDYSTTVSAYGIITRVMTFVFLPLLGLSMAFQSITGNNVGARQWQRTNSSIKISLTTALIYCLSVQMIINLIKDDIGFFFVDDLSVVSEVGRILTVSTQALFLMGPLMIISMFFQSIGDKARAGILGLAKTFAFALPLIFLLPLLLGEIGIWYAGPVAELLALILTITVLYQRSRQRNHRFGLFYAVENRYS